MPFTADTDVITAGSLNRAFVMGFGASQVGLNNVIFERFGKNQEKNQNSDNVTDGDTSLVTGAIGQDINTDSQQNNRGLEGLTTAYRTLLRSGVSGGGSPWALILNGLVVGQTYHFQIWFRDPLHPKMTATVSGGTNDIQIDTSHGCYLIGTFVADNTQQIISFTPQIGTPYIEAFQLRQVDDVKAASEIVRQPSHVTIGTGTTTGLSVFVMGANNRYQWQRVEGSNPSNLTDGDDLSGTKTSTLRFNAIKPEQAGVYRVMVVNQAGTLVSSNVMVTVESDPLINMAVRGQNLVHYKGSAVLLGGPDDQWNILDARQSFTNAPLFDSTGVSTPVTLTLIKSDGDAVPHALLGGISYAAKQVVTIKNLQPNEYYDLVVFSVGGERNEGGVFSGAVTGNVRGYGSPGTVPEEFLAGINYIESPFARTDTNGTLEFTIKPNATVATDGYRNGDFNGLQLRKSSINDSRVVINKQPESLTTYEHQPAFLNIVAVSPPDASTSFQWQKVTSQTARNLGNHSNLSGATSDTLVFKKLSADDNGCYQVVISNSFGAVTSSLAVITVLTNQLINIAVLPGGGKSDYQGLAVLPGTRNDHWNGVDARHSFSDQPLFDSTGKPTAITLSLEKSDGDALPHALLGGISYASAQTLTINHLIPNEFYDLVIFSIGGEQNEGGVFSGGVNGLSRGYPTRGMIGGGFFRNTNYVENSFAKTDDQGTLTINILPNLTVMPEGYFNCDFNGLQLLKVPLERQPPVITEPPVSTRAYLRHPAILSVIAASPINAPVSYQWQRITDAGAIHVVDSNNIFGSKSNTLSFQSMLPAVAGRYQVVVKNSFGSVTSSVVKLTIATNQLINVAVNPGERITSYKGLAVFAGATNDFWNGIDARRSITSKPLFDAIGAITLVTLSLSKHGEGSAIPCRLMGGISYATNQEVTINHLLPNQLYDVVVFSAGGERNEGGVFSGAVKGVANGYPKRGAIQAEFQAGVNYVENRTAYSDGKGTLTFTINPLSTIMPDGYYNCDFNGLQITEAAEFPHVPGK